LKFNHKESKKPVSKLVPEYFIPKLRYCIVFGMKSIDSKQYSIKIRCNPNPAWVAALF